MELQDIVRVVVLLSVLQITISHGQLKRPKSIDMTGEICKTIGKEPYFDNELVIGKPWRSYYTWKINVGHRCNDIVFKNATSMMIDRFWHDMNEYLEHQPYWAAASLHMTLGSAEREVLLFSNQGPAGSFDAVPNVIREGQIAPQRRSVPLLKFQMKLIGDNKYLLISDCHIGVVSLSARADDPPYKMEIAEIATKLNFNEGFPACVNEKKKDEQFYIQ